MTTTHEPAITERDGVLAGPMRAPRNLAATVRGSIHDDATAHKLGFRGGTVAGSIHMEQFPPLLVAAFGQRWWETGSLSCYFRNATQGGEPVRAFVRKPAGAADEQVDVWMERDDGTLVLEATASIGNPSEASLLRRKLAEPREPGEQRMLGHLTPGQRIGEVSVCLAGDPTVDTRLRALTEPSDWYTGASPWGGPIVNPGLLVHLMVKAQTQVDLDRSRAVGLYGAIEVRHTNGPVLAEQRYTVDGTVLAVGQTPKTEYLWYETTMRDDARRDIASMLMMLRFMKASSKLWA